MGIVTMRTWVAFAVLAALLLAATMAWHLPMMLWDHIDLVPMYEAWRSGALGSSAFWQVHDGSHLHVAAYAVLLVTTWASGGQPWLDCLASVVLPAPRSALNTAAQCSSSVTTRLFLPSALKALAATGTQATSAERIKVATISWLARGSLTPHRYGSCSLLDELALSEKAPAVRAATAVSRAKRCFIEIFKQKHFIL